MAETSPQPLERYGALRAYALSITTGCMPYLVSVTSLGNKGRPPSLFD